MPFALAHYKLLLPVLRSRHALCYGRSTTRTTAAIRAYYGHRLYDGRRNIAFSVQTGTAYGVNNNIEQRKPLAKRLITI